MVQYNKNWVWAIPLSIFLSIFPLMMLNNLSPTLSSGDFECNSHITSCKEALSMYLNNTLKENKYVKEDYTKAVAHNRGVEDNTCMVKTHMWNYTTNTYDYIKTEEVLC